MFLVCLQSVCCRCRAGKGKGTPALRRGIHTVGIDVEDESEGSDWQGFWLDQSMSLHESTSISCHTDVLPSKPAGTWLLLHLRHCVRHRFVYERRATRVWYVHDIVLFSVLFSFRYSRVYTVHISLFAVVSRVQTPGYVPKKTPLGFFGYTHPKKPTLLL